MIWKLSFRSPYRVPTLPAINHCKDQVLAVRDARQADADYMQDHQRQRDVGECAVQLAKRALAISPLRRIFRSPRR